MFRQLVPLAALGGLILTFCLEAGAVREPARRIEVVPEGTAWFAGHGGVAPLSSVVPVPDGFAARNGGKWTQRLSGPTGGFRQGWGSGIDVGSAALESPVAAAAAAEAFWSANPELLPAGVWIEDLEPLANVLTHGIRLVSHRQTVGGIPVLGTGNWVAIKHGRLVLFGARNFAVPAIDTTPALPAQRAVELAVAALAAQGVHGAAGEPRLAIFPLVVEDTTTFELVYQVPLRSPRVGRWTAWIGARGGRLVALRDERVFMTGELKIEHHDRNPHEDLIASPAQRLDLTVDDGATTTDELGVFDSAGDTTDLLAMLTGTYINVTSVASDELMLELSGLVDGASHTWSDDTEYGMAQLHGYVFANLVRNKAKQLSPGLAVFDEQFQVNVNTLYMDDDSNPDHCNAWYDGEAINFLTYGGGGYACNNTAMVADIVFHEYGHHYHWSNAIYVGGFYPNEAIGEAFADTMAVVMTHDHLIGPYFFVDGYAVRDVEPNVSWPEGESEDYYQTSLIVSGALWDLRKGLVEEYGEEAHQIVDDIYAVLVHTTTEVPELWETSLLADDDNGDLNDGTPHYCPILDAYELHGLVADGLGRVAVTHEQVGAVDAPQTAVPIEAAISVISEECSTLGEVRLSYSTNEGETWDTMVMEAGSDDLFTGEIPGQPEGTLVYYRFEIDEEDSGKTFYKPVNPAERYYKMYVGPLDTIVFDDFEEEDPAWTHELLWSLDTPSEGADDWMRDVPKGTGGDPVGAYSGQYAWGNDLTPEDNWNGQYQPNKRNTLRSPTYDLSGYDHVRLRFRRWLGVEDAVYDKASIYVNEQLAWVNVSGGGGTAHVDREWIIEDVDISEWAAGQPEVQVRFEIFSDGAREYGGWTIDDFGLYTKGALPDPIADGGPAVDGGVSFSATGSGCGCHTTGDAARGGTPNLLAVVLAALLG